MNVGKVRKYDDEKVLFREKNVFLFLFLEAFFLQKWEGQKVPEVSGRLVFTFPAHMGQFWTCLLVAAKIQDLIIGQLMLQISPTSWLSEYDAMRTFQLSVREIMNACWVPFMLSLKSFIGQCMISCIQWVIITVYVKQASHIMVVVDVIARF